MALSKIDVANMLTGTIPQGNVANASLNAVTALPAAIPTGKVLQFSLTSSNTNASNTSTTTYVVGAPNASITPASTSNKIYLEFNICVYQTLASGSQDSAFQYELYRDTSLLTTSGSVQYYTSAGWSGNIRKMFMFGYLDSPSSTSAVNYNYKFRNPHNAGSMQVNQGNMLSYLKLMEIEA
jgi:hypothetical protein